MHTSASHRTSGMVNSVPKGCTNLMTSFRLVTIAITWAVLSILATQAQEQVGLLASFRLDGTDSPSVLITTNLVLSDGPFGETNGAMVFPDSGFAGSVTTDFFKNRTQWSWAGWIKPFTTGSQAQYLYSEGNQGESCRLYLSDNEVGVGLWNEDQPVNNWTDIRTSPVIQLGKWQHIAVTFDASTNEIGTCRIYVNAVQVLSGMLPMEKATDPFRSTTHDFCFGANAGAFTATQVPDLLYGAISEVEIYGRVISASEIEAMQPVKVSPPLSLSVSLGANPTFSVTGGVPKPLAIQWSHNGKVLTSATNATLTLTNVTLAQAGDYSVAIAMGGGIQFFGPWTLGVDPTFTKITDGSIVNDGGDSVSCAWGDYDGDGFLDLAVANASGQNEFLYHNNGNGAFTKVAIGPLVTSGHNSTALAWADFDNNGTLDLFVANYDNQNSFLFQNIGNGAFLQVTNGSAVNTGGLSAACAWADYDNDGNLDLFVANNSTNGNFLYHGNGDGTFDRVTTGAISTDRLAAFSDGVWGDYNNDGKPDLFLCTDGGNNALYRNEGNGEFTRITSGIIVNDGPSSSAAWADYDNDGYLDLVTTHSGEPHLYHNNGAGGFTVTALSTPGKTLTGCAWGDYDNDGFLDLFLTEREGHGSVLFHNNGDGTFARVTTGSLVNDAAFSWGARWGDYDNDGFLDLFVCNRPDSSGFANNFLYRNNANTNHWVKANLIGTRSNRSGIGAKVRLKADIGGREMWQLREVASGGGYGQASLDVHFGLGDATNVESLTIEWPSGIVQEIHDLSPNRSLSIVEPPVLRVGRGLTVAGFELILESRGGYSYDILQSGELKTWTQFKTIKQVNGAVQVLDTSASANIRQFYKAVLKQ